jgi:hypothetical protein
MESLEVELLSISARLNPSRTAGPGIDIPSLPHACPTTPKKSCVV